MKKIILAAAFLIGGIASAAAACVSPAVMHDFPGTSFNMSLATNAGDGNCASNIAVVGTLPAYAAIPAFKFDQTTPGTTNGVQVNAALPAGTNIIGKVGIDQTTPGTTNLVSIGTNGTVNPQTAANWGIGTSTQNSAIVANGQLALAQFNTTPTTITTGNMSPMQLDSAGKLLVNCTGCSSSGSITTWAGGTLGAMANYGTSPGAVLVPGVNAFVTNSNANGRAVSGSSSPVVPTPALSTWHLINATGTNATSVKGSAATVFSCQLGSIAGPAFLKIYNKATAPTVGTDTPVKTLIIPVAATAANGAGSNISFGPGGLTLSTGFAAALTTGITVADTGSTTASTLAINCDYE